MTIRDKVLPIIVEGDLQKLHNTKEELQNIIRSIEVKEREVYLEKNFNRGIQIGLVSKLYNEFIDKSGYVLTVESLSEIETDLIYRFKKKDEFIESTYIKYITELDLWALTDMWDWHKLTSIFNLRNEEDLEKVKERYYIK